MQTNYLEAISTVLNLMKQPDSVCKNISMHRTCYTTLFKYLMDNGISFSMDAALEWLEIKKKEVSYETYTQYRNALLRLEHYLLFGNIVSPFYKTEEDFFVRSGISESFFFLLSEMEEYFNVEQNPCYYHTYSVSFKNFFQVATSNGVTEPEAITLDTLVDYWSQYCTTGPERKRQNAICAMSVLMKYLHKRNDVPACYSLALFNENAEKIAKMHVIDAGTAFHPSMDLEPKAEAFLSALDEWQYLESSKNVFRNSLTWYFLFLEINEVNHSEENAEIFFSVLPEYPNASKQTSTPKSHHIHTVKMFTEFLNGCMTTNLLKKNLPDALAALPEWSASILSGFVDARKRDGMTEKTITMCKAAGKNFFLYLEKTGIDNCLEITPKVVIDFHNQDFHSTNESKNAYSIKLRQLLRYMAEQELVPKTLEYAIPTVYAPHRDIVEVLSDDMVDKIFDYRNKATTAIELRDIAIVMLGLRMGIRGVDILNLKVSDFDWQNKTVSFVQQKTSTAITLPVPTDVGNSIYQYIAYGRPKAAKEADGFIFIHHVAPYVPLKTTTACKGALKRVLAAYNYELPKGQGFHMTRKTFATKMLRANNRLDDISNALGHARQETAEVYLERDEESMRLCPLKFGGVWS